MGIDLAVDTELAFASAVAAAALVSAFLVLASIFTVRAWRYWRGRGLAVREQRWREVLAAAADDPQAAPLPRIRRLDAPHFARCWTRLQHGLAPEASDNMAALLRRHAADALFLSLLRSPWPWRRLIAINALGRLRVRTSRLFRLASG